MKALFTGILNVSLSGSLIICLIILLRLLFKKAPKALICALWALAILRLLLPFQIETSFSLRPDTPVFTVRDTELTMDATPVPEEEVPDYIPQTALGKTKTVMVDYIAIAGYVWAAVALGMGAYTLISYLRLKRRVRNAVVMEDGVFAAAELHTAILLGYLRPRIYLPVGMADREAALVIAHERAHLKRGDNWLKLFGFLCLCLHWFNPLVWVAYILLCRDIENACDEQVIRDLNTEDRKLYSSALLSCGKERPSLAGCPVAFGEISIRQRILNVLNYRKPTLWISIAAVMAVLLTAIFFMTDPIRENPPYYDIMVSSLGEELDTVCEELGIPEVSGETPTTVEYLGISFKLHIYADEFRTRNTIYSFEYVAEYKNDPETAARDIVTLARYHWRRYGEGLNADHKRYPQILSYITEEDIVKQIKTNQNRETDNRIINDSWDVTEQSSSSLKRFLKELEESEINLNSLDIGEELTNLKPYLAYSIESFLDTQSEEKDTVKIVLSYRILNNYNRENKFFATYAEKQTWWDKLLYWLKQIKTY